MFTRSIFLLFFLFISFNLFGQSSALVIVDMQAYFSERNYEGSKVPVGNTKKLKKVLSEQIAAIKMARKFNVPIIFVEYEVPEAAGTLQELLDHTKNYSKKISIVKPTDGLFQMKVFKGSNAMSEKEIMKRSKFDLAEKLKLWNIDSLVMIGANGGACVHESICGALYNDFKIVTYGEAIIDFNYDNFVYPYYYSKHASFSKDIKQVSKRSDLNKYFSQCNRNLINPKGLF